MSLVRCVACGIWACTPLRAQRASRSKQQPATTHISRACVRLCVWVCEPAFARSTSGLRCVYVRADRFSFHLFFFHFFPFFHFDWYTRTVHSRCYALLRTLQFSPQSLSLPRICNSKLLIFHYSVSRKRKWWIRNNEHFDSNKRRRRRRITVGSTPWRTKLFTKWNQSRRLWPSAEHEPHQSTDDSECWYLSV